MGENRLSDGIHVFETDMHRHILAQSGEIQALKDTYDGRFPELGDISTGKKWDQLLTENKTVPHVRIQRLSKVVRLFDQANSVLDIGVGWGDIVPLLKREHPNVGYTGIDFSNEVIKQLSEQYPEFRFFCSGVDKINEMFDTVLLLEVMEHIPPSHIFDILAHVKRVLSPHGRLIVTVPYREDLSQNTFICGHCGKYVNRMGHVRSYSRTLLKAEMQLAGFRPLRDELMYDGCNGLSGNIKKSTRNLLRWLWDRHTYQPLKAVCQIAVFGHSD